jgi:hypothetical protein
MKFSDIPVIKTLLAKYFGKKLEVASLTFSTNVFTLTAANKSVYLEKFCNLANGANGTIVLETAGMTAGNVIGFRVNDAFEYTFQSPAGAITTLKSYGVNTRTRSSTR